MYLESVNRLKYKVNKIEEVKKTNEKLQRKQRRDSQENTDENSDQEEYEYYSESGGPTPKNMSDEAEAELVYEIQKNYRIEQD